MGCNYELLHTGLCVIWYRWHPPHGRGDAQCSCDRSGKLCEILQNSPLLTSYVLLAGYASVYGLQWCHVTFRCIGAGILLRELGGVSGERVSLHLSSSFPNSNTYHCLPYVPWFIDTLHSTAGGIVFLILVVVLLK